MVDLNDYDKRRQTSKEGDGTKRKKVSRGYSFISRKSLRSARTRKGNQSVFSKGKAEPEKPVP